VVPEDEFKKKCKRLQRATKCLCTTANSFFKIPFEFAPEAIFDREVRYVAQSCNKQVLAVVVLY
jgi:hypothetical protein